MYIICSFTSTSEFGNCTRYEYWTRLSIFL